MGDFPGEYWFIAGCTLTALFALGHLGGALATERQARTDRALAEAFEGLDRYRCKAGGMETSLLHLRRYFSFSFSLLLLAVAVISVLAIGLARDAGAAARVIALANAVLSALVCLLSFRFRVFQGIVSAAVIAAVFLVAAMRAGPAM